MACSKALYRLAPSEVLYKSRRLYEACSEALYEALYTITKCKKGCLEEE